MSDDYPEFPAFLLRTKPEPKPQSESVSMKTDTDTAAEDSAHDEIAPLPKAKKAKAKVKKAKANGHAKEPVKKAKTKKDAKRAPRVRDPSKLDEFGFRKGTIKSRAALMYKKGATLAEVRDEVGSVQFNLLTELETAGFEIKKTTVKGTGGARDATKYKVLGKSK